MDRLTPIIEPMYSLLSTSEATIALQPIFDLQQADLTVSLYETLLRVPQSSDPQFHVHLLTLAEQLGFVHYLDLFVLAEVVSLLRADTVAHVAINLSQRSIFQNADAIVRQLCATQMCHRITVEITETSRIPPRWIAAFAATVRTLGCRLAVDDYETGFADVQLVRAVQPTILKIAMDNTSQPIIDRLNRTTSLAREIGADVVMERIDSIEKLALARKHGVRYGQGFMLAKPILARDLSACSWPSADATVPIEDRNAPAIRHDLARGCKPLNGHRDVCFKQETGS